jgi:predicted aldo/keto reductase-like oxidoreductase
MRNRVGPISRREFLKAGAVGVGAAVGAGVAAPLALQERNGEIPVRPLGETGLKVSVIGFGSYGFSNAAVLEAAIDRGVSLVCTAATYQNGNAERAIGEVLKKRRDQVVLCTGWRPPDAGTVDAHVTALDESLRRLQTDHIDIMRIHLCDDPEELGHHAIFDAFEKAREAGKVRFLGVSGHGKRLPNVFQEAIRLKSYHVLMGKYNFMEYPKQPAAIKLAGEQGLGVIAFKVGAGKQEPFIKELTNKGMDFRRACVKWALSNETVSSVLHLFTNLDDVDGLTVGLGEQLSDYEERMLAIYRKAVESTYCRYCGTCAEGCPNDVEVADIMRYKMYFCNYGLQKDAMQLYASIPVGRNASQCATCSGDCLGHCPHGLLTRENLLSAHSLLI